MITNNQLMLATACLFSVALLSGCVSKSTVSDNNIETSPVVEVVEASAVTEPEIAEIIEVEDAIKAIESIKTVGITDANEADAPKVTTTKDGVVVIPLGTSLEEVAAATAKPVALPNIPNIAKALANHQNSMWHSRSFTYSIYLGGHLNAEYSQEKNALTIINQADEANQFACQYSTKNGGLASIKDDEVSACHSLANELQSYLDEE